ncbi:hypothetical protein G9A89_001282 [Geosiphon pyriformis]|nr:hypothetical protein G9A89_001282 [Geosiphon pyriformis]
MCACVCVCVETNTCTYLGIKAIQFTRSIVKNTKTLLEKKSNVPKIPKDIKAHLLIRSNNSTPIDYYFNYSKKILSANKNFKEHFHVSRQQGFDYDTSSFAKTLVEDRSVLNLLASKANIAWTGYCYLKDIYSLGQANNNISVVSINHDNSKITFAFADITESNFKTLAETTSFRFPVVKFPDVAGAGVAFTYYSKWKKRVQKLFFDRLESYLIIPARKLDYSEMEVDYSYFEFTGYGEGSPYAIFAALEFVERYRPKKRPIIVTFGQPRMGNEIFVAYAQSQLEIFRVTFVDDWLPNMPIRGKKTFVKWSDENERPKNSFPLIYEVYRHFKPEFWIDDEKSDCECTEDVYPKVYKCFSKLSYDEHPECNARKHDWEFTKKIKSDGKSDAFLYGPYFGKRMNNCEGLNISNIIVTQRKRKVKAFYSIFLIFIFQFFFQISHDVELRNIFSRPFLTQKYKHHQFFHFLLSVTGSQNDRADFLLRRATSQYPKKRAYNISHKEELIKLAMTAIYTNAAYCDPHNQIGKLVENGNKVTADVGVDERGRVMVAYFKGPQLTKAKWITRRSQLVPYRVQGMVTNALVKVDQEWFTDVSTMMNALVEKINDKIKRTRKIFFCGHGVGGAYAAIAGLSFAIMKLLQPSSSSVDPIDLSIYTFGQPRIGNTMFARMMNEFVKITRITRLNDYVPHFPPVESEQSIMLHHEREIWIGPKDCDCTRDTLIYNDDVIWDCGESKKNFELNLVRMNQFIQEKFWTPGDIFAGESQECNSGQSISEENTNREHYGPYFGVIMNDCTGYI